MESKDFGETLNGSMTAHIPMVSVHTSEWMSTISNVLDFSLLAVPAMQTTVSTASGTTKAPMGKKARVLVWRMGDGGFREWNRYYPSGHSLQHQVLQSVEGPEDPDLENTMPRASKEIIMPEEEEGPASDAISFIENWDDEQNGPVIFIMRDFHYFLNPLQGTQKGMITEMEPLVDRMRRTCEAITGLAKYVQIIITHETRWQIPAELDSYVHRVRIDPPSKEERIETATFMVDGILESEFSRKQYPGVSELDATRIEDIADAGAGLTAIQYENLLCMSLAKNGTMQSEFVLREKAKLVEQAGFKLITPKVTFDEVGGLAPLKTWARRRKRRFTDDAYAYGFRRAPRGMLLAGVPGCGKTLLAKATAKEWGMNIIAVRAPDLKGSLVGESEEKTQKLLDMAEANGPCVVFIDEAEKLLGSQESVRDGGAHDAVLAQFLSFMQDNEAGVYFIFTANQMNKFPPELIDRFEGRWFVDLPSADEREGILRIHLTLNSSDRNGLLDIANNASHMESLVKMCEGYSGRNIEQAIEEAMDIGFDENRLTTFEDLKTVFSEMKPTSETKKADIEAMREFVGNGTMRMANTPESSESGGNAVESFKAHRGFA